jgi:hypothetical protein
VPEPRVSLGTCLSVGIDNGKLITDHICGFSTKKTAASRPEGSEQTTTMVSRNSGKYVLATGPIFRGQPLLQPTVPMSAEPIRHEFIQDQFGADPYGRRMSLMNEASAVEPFSCPRSPLCTKDKVVIALVVLYSSVALTLELYWIIFHQVMEFRTDLFARVLRFYWPADHSWRIQGYPAEKAFVLSLDLVNVF